MENLETTIIKTFNILRFLFDEDKKTLRTIDKIYENLILKEISIIPKEYKQTIEEVIYYVEIVLESIDYNNIYEKTKHMKDSIGVELNLYKLVLNKIKTLKIIESNIERNYLKALTKKLKPVLDCIGKILYNPYSYFERIILLKNDEIKELNKLF